MLREAPLHFGSQLWKVSPHVAALNPPFSPEEIFRRLLDESSVLLASPQDAGVAIPDDDLHRDILVPLLPAMLGDGAIRKHWHDQAATGFLARLTRHLRDGEAAPRWQPSDFEIHVTASYSAGPDAKALADTLLSEDPLRDMSAALMNQVLAAVWPKLELAAVEVIPAEVEAAAAPVVEPAVEAVPVPELSVATEDATAVASDAARASLALPPLPAAMIQHRPKWRAVRTGRENPISGAKTWRGRIGEPDWSHSYPLAGGTAAP